GHFGVAVEQDDVSPLVREGLRNGVADAAGRAGDDGHLSVQLKVHAVTPESVMPVPGRDERPGAGPRGTAGPARRASAPGAAYSRIRNKPTARCRSRRGTATAHGHPSP